MDEDHCWGAIQSRDGRFDGVFVTAVTSTGIYCRPSCPAMTPKRSNVRFFPSAAAAQEAGFRACKRCSPDAAPGSPEWSLRADLVGRAMRLIADGTVERVGVGGLASRLNYGTRQLHRLLLAQVGAGPLALARAHRVQSARTLLESTDLPISEVAFAAGFASIRQFNATIRDVFAATPSELRGRPSGRASPNGTGMIAVKLFYRTPLDTRSLFAFLGERAVPGVEELVDGTYRRVLDLPGGPGIVELETTDRADPARPDNGFVACRLQLPDIRDFTAAVQRCRLLLDLDADPGAVAAAFGHDPLLRRVHSTGLRIPGSVDPHELAFRAVLGQQVSVAAARRAAGELVARYGTPLQEPAGRLTHCFPSAAALASANLEPVRLPSRRRETLRTLAQALASGDVCLDPGADRDEAERGLLVVPGIGRWTAQYVRMRALGDPDAFLEDDLGVRRALERLGVPASPAAAARLAEGWRPWRSYAVQQLWAMGPGARSRRSPPARNRPQESRSRPARPSDTRGADNGIAVD